MTPQQFKRVEELFDAICDLPESERSDYLDSHCLDDAQVRLRVESMLQNDLAAVAAFDTPALGEQFKLQDIADNSESDTAVGLPDRIGQYTVIRKLGEGGMGVVLEARQDQPARHVAIKLVRDSFPSAESLRRFSREIELLGQLQHPCIAHIYEAGSIQTPTGAGQPYFAMEYIDGLPLTKYAEDGGLDVRQKLLLMATVCDAVSYAHQRGILHRDLKPGNILVKRVANSSTVSDSRGDSSHGIVSGELQAVPKILDFGLGRLMDERAHEGSLQTHTGRIVGTLAYMSPEQIDGNSGRLDVRTDVYALGVILYELLSARRPHELGGLSIAESARTIREDEPGSLALISRVFRGDVSTIVGKAIAKDREQRYASAADFAADIRRFLNDEPIIARPATTIYQMRKFARRHKAIFAGGLIAIFAMLVAIVVSSRQAIIATAARDEAQREAHKAIEINRFLQGIFSSEAFDGRLGEDVSAVSLLDVAAERLDSGHFGDQPDVIAELHITLGHSYLTLGGYAAGQQHFESARKIIKDIPDATVISARILEGLGSAHELQNEYEDAERCFRDAREYWVKSGQPEYATSGIWPLGLPSVLYLTGRYDEAEQMFREALAIARQNLEPNDARIAQALAGLGATLEAKSQPIEAIKAHQESADIYRDTQGDKSMHLANCLNNLGNAKQAAGDNVGAAAALREALSIRKLIFKGDHPDIAMGLSNLGLVLMNVGEYEESERMLREALAIRRRVLPGIHHSTASTLNNLALTLRAMERFDEALDYHTQAVEVAEQAVPEGHLLVIILRANRAFGLFKLGRSEEAEPIMLKCHAQLVESVGPNHRRTRKVATELAKLYEQTNRNEKAQEWLRRSMLNR
ncbi:MAG: hypothetical protein DHS20C16_31110 [Phycisphaerae bacterium]|nr:MAG: hypothetical protein DHS20C16_31110 [Phycisphaerae bacterium]